MNVKLARERPDSGRASRRILTVALVCGGFGIGVSEFIVMGLLPQIAADLVPALYESRPDTALAATGGLASSYALGVVVGMVVTPMIVRKLSERSALLVCSGAMLVWTLLIAFAPNLPVAIALRFLAALTHASYIGIGAMAVAHMHGTNHYGRGSAILHGGLAAANLLGVPVLTALGADGDWRLIIGGCSALFAMPFIALLCISMRGSVSYDPPQDGPSGWLRGRLVVLSLAAVLIAASGFAVITYIAPVIAWVGERWATPGAGWLTAATGMFAFGIGMNAGNFVAGWFADRAAGLTFVACAATGVVGGGLLLVPGIGQVGTAIAMLLFGVVLGGTGPSGQVLYLRELRDFPRLASSMPSGIGNLGSFVGSLAGAGLLATQGAAALPVGALVLVGGGLLCFALQVKRRQSE